MSWFTVKDPKGNYWLDIAHLRSWEVREEVETRLGASWGDLEKVGYKVVNIAVIERRQGTPLALEAWAATLDAQLTRARKTIARLRNELRQEKSTPRCWCCGQKARANLPSPAAGAPTTEDRP